MRTFNKINLFILFVITTFVIIIPTYASADAIIGEPVVTLGKDLTGTQQDAILEEMQVPAGVKIIEVTNEEEHQYLGQYISRATIGTKAISSAKITLTDSGTGISVKTNNITDITENMYSNAAITAGIKDADIYVTAPFRVSGTAGLTGIIKAFETATGKKIDENQKQVANEEIVRTSDVAKEIGDPNKAVQFMNSIKEKIATENPQTPEEHKDIIINVANEFNINLNQKTIDQLVKFSQNYSSLNIDWDQLKSQLESFRGNINNTLNSEQTQGIIDKILDGLRGILQVISNKLSELLH
ncbi:DUF1002 domain-containing protein [Desulfolucanica intricata]|uniref:DUF1002 domain-containing protein n=1 Tax=Desulfolucanica intricata TaxID=1285191 RepID=UPI0009EDFBEF